MRLLRMLVVSLGLACAWAAGAEAGQDVVRLRSDCLDEAPPACFTDSGSLMTWLWGTRNPSAASPVLVDIGPGEFTRLDCPSGMGHVTFRGSGQDNTVIRGGAKSPSNPQNPSYGIVTPQTMGFGASSVLGMALGGQITPGSPAAGCSNVSVQDLTIVSTGTAVLWEGAGNSKWTNVTLRSPNYVWYDNSGPGGGIGEHFWWSSSVFAEVDQGFALAPAVAFVSATGRHFFYGGEIRARVAPGASISGSLGLTALALYGSSDVRLYGSAVRSVAKNGSGVTFSNLAQSASPLAGVNGVVLYGDAGAVFHMHGGIIAADARDTGPGAYATGLRVDGPNQAHTPDTAFVVYGGPGGTQTRVATANGGMAMSPFLWEAGPTPPRGTDSAPTLTSIDGYDLFVETDCASNGNCTSGPGRDETHLMIYDATKCQAGNPWFDVVTGRCRNQTQ